jgi:hypothetical protein
MTEEIEAGAVAEAVAVIAVVPDTVELLVGAVMETAGGELGHEV